MPTTEAARQRKVRENRLREAAKRQGLTLSKSRRRDPLALDYGMYSLGRVDLERNTATRGERLWTGKETRSLDQIEKWLKEGVGRREAGDD